MTEQHKPSNTNPQDKLNPEFNSGVNLKSVKLNPHGEQTNSISLTFIFWVSLYGNNGFSFAYAPPSLTGCSPKIGTLLITI